MMQVMNWNEQWILSFESFASSLWLSYLSQACFDFMPEYIMIQWELCKWNQYEIRIRQCVFVGTNGIELKSFVDLL